jgi:hypothetical protein
MKTLLLILLLVPMMSFGQAPNYVPSNGLIGYWPFNGNANDESGNGNNGSVNNAALLTTDRYGNSNNAYYFDGTDNSDIDVPSSNDLNITNDITISFWIFSNSNSGEKHIIDRDLCGFNNDWRILQVNNSVHWSSGVSGSDQFVSVSLIANQWNFIVAKREGNLFTLTINDSFSSPSQMTLNNSSFGNNSIPIFFGDAVCNSPSQNNFLGKLDDIGIWNRALSQQEITDLFISCTPTSSIDSHTVCESYTWLDGNIYTSSNNTATYTTINAAGCDSVITLDLTIWSAPEPTISQNGSTLACTNFASGYQWLDCDANYNPIIGETGMTFTATQSGNYALEISFNDCSDTSECFSIDFTGIGELNNTPKQLIKIVDVLGRETPFKPNTPLLYIYNDGTVERKVVLK